MRTYLDFEKPIAELESRVAELRALTRGEETVPITDELTRLEAKTRDALENTYANLSPWQKTQVARHPDRPHARDYIEALIEDFTPLAGDRHFAEDHAIVGGLGTFEGHPVMVIGNEKGYDTESRLKHNFGMARPEGYRKAIRLMTLADRFALPVITLVDTAGAYPGIGAEERGQAEAIARSIDCCMGLGVPIVAAVIGEGGSGGAVAIATANSVIMLEQDLKTLGVIDEIVPEPLGGAHRDAAATIAATGAAITSAVARFEGIEGDEIRGQRRRKFLQMGESL
jgi:acetyl-CoA carboxylase carboxyl transferase subunit alpha